MSWKYDRAKFFGTKTNPKVGDHVKVRITNDTDPENPQEIIYKWTFDPADGRTLDKFRDMVKFEVAAHLRSLNKTLKESDVSSEFDPT